MLGVCFLLLSVAVFAQVDQAKFSELHPAGLSVQIAGGVDLAYYTQDHDLCFGIFGFTLTQEKKDSTETNVMKPGVFIRKNFPLTTHVTWGIGASYGTIMGGGHTEATRFKQYFSIEYAATDRIYILASIRTINYESYTLNSSETTTAEYLGGSSVQLAYRF